MACGFVLVLLFLPSRVDEIALEKTWSLLTRDIHTGGERGTQRGAGGMCLCVCMLYVVYICFEGMYTCTLRAEVDVKYLLSFSTFFF